MGEAARLLREGKDELKQQYHPDPVNQIQYLY
jgi:hypothetical protein